MSEQTTNSEYENYYVPEKSKLPFVGSIGLFITAMGAGRMMNDEAFGGWMLLIGIAILVGMLSTWWSYTIKESMSGLYSSQMSRSFRQGMMWFITSEVMFFFAFFGALFYIRAFVLPLLGGDFNGASTHDQLFPEYTPAWPMTEMPGDFIPSEGFSDNKLQQGVAADSWRAMGAWGLPAINTAILLTSSWTLTIAHHALLEKNRPTLVLFTSITAMLGIIFLGLQAYEYYEAYAHYGLTLQSGVYGSTFFLLTGFHGMHVLIGTIFLIVLSLRTAKGHFTAKEHFAFEAGAWYWHFVDVVWVFLFIFVYMM